MSTWTFRTLMTILGIVIIAQLVMLVITKPRPIMCLGGVIMEQHDDMWIQVGMFPKFCVPIDKD
jgi:hypothetical protein